MLYVVCGLPGSALAAALLILSPGIAWGAPPQPFQATYTLSSHGARIARMKRILSRAGDGTWLYRSETRATGLMAFIRHDRVVEQSTWVVAGGRMRPLAYLYDRSGGKKDRNVMVRFDWDEQRIINTINGDSWRMPTEPNVMDKLLYQFAIMRDLAAKRMPLSYTIADGGKTKLYRFERVGEEVIETPLGRLTTIKLLRHKEHSVKETLLWCAPDLGYLPVRVENTERDGDTTTALIESVTGLYSGAAER